jgi:hypothetical protein
VSTPSSATIKRLIAVSRNNCAFPDCSTLLVDSRGIFIGHICHINGNKPGAARYDPVQSEEQRQSFENLILMCPTHHAKIDRDESFYTVTMLREVKARHEASQPANYQLDDTSLRGFLDNLIRQQAVTTPIDVADRGLETINDKIRERTDFLHTLEERVSRPESFPNTVSLINEVRKDLSRLKSQANAIAPGTYSELEVSPPTRFYSPPQRQYFTGRTEIMETILSGLDPEERTWVVSIDGLGGIGKTAVAAEVAYECSRQGAFEQVICGLQRSRDN